MRKLLVLILSFTLIFSGCTSSADKENDTDKQEKEMITSDNYFSEGNKLEDVLEKVELIEMTDDDKKNFNDSIEAYSYVDPTLSESDVNYLIERTADGTYNAVVIFSKAKDSLPEDFNMKMTEAIMGALSVNGLSVEYNKLQVIIYDTDGTIYKSEVFENK